MIMRTISMPFLNVVSLLALLSLSSCTDDGGQNATTNDSVDEDSTATADTADASPLANDTAEENDTEDPGFPDTVDTAQSDDAGIAEEDVIISDTEEDAAIIPDTEEETDAANVEEEDSATPDAVEEIDTANADDEDATEVLDTSAPDDTAQADDDAGSENGDEGDLESCQDACAAADLVCTQPCGGSPLCLAQCAAAYTECNDDCDGTFGG
jgi:hypothetical protein